MIASYERFYSAEILREYIAWIHGNLGLEKEPKGSVDSTFENNILTQKANTALYNQKEPAYYETLKWTIVTFGFGHLNRSIALNSNIVNQTFYKRDYLKTP